MRRFLALLGVVLPGVVGASDWQFAGGTKMENVEARQFFDAESVSHPAKDVTRVWIKSIRVRDFDAYYKAHEKSIVDKAARKIASGYIPNFLLLPGVRTSFADSTALENAAAEITGDEVMANSSNIEPVNKLYFEIDCAGKRIKLLNAGRLQDYKFIEPDSNGERLSLLVCQPK